MRLVLVRHGQTASNRMQALDTALPGAELDEVGVWQAQKLADQWDDIVGVVPDVLVASPTLRTQQTARPLSERFALPVHVDERLREVRAGDMEMRTDTASTRKYLEVVLAWLGADLAMRMPGAEDGHETLGRLQDGLDAAFQLARKCQHPDENLTVVAVVHGVVCRLLTATLATNVPVPLVANYPMHNATTTVLESHDGANWQALTWSNRQVTEYDLKGLTATPVVSGLRGRD